MLNFFNLDPQQLVIYLMRVPVILLAISIHESAHAYVSDKLGDPTARYAGRISLNPLRHLNPIGMIMMLLVGFGWASPVMINPRNFKKPKLGMALSALAGPVSNLILGFIGAIGVVYVGRFGGDSTAAYAVWLFFLVLMQLNISLAVFNLIPLPPLDGSRILLLFLPERIYFKLMRYEQYIIIALIILMITDIITVPIGAATAAISNGMLWIARLPLRLFA